MRGKYASRDGLFNDPQALSRRETTAQVVDPYCVFVTVTAQGAGHHSILDYSGLIFAALMIGHHFSISAL